MPTSPPSAPPRERLLDTADRLFYREGVSTVGINSLLEQAGVARASLYSTFGSKDELVREYLRRRSRRWRATVAEALANRWDNPRDRVLGVFTLLGEWFETPDYRGCPFINASVEEPPAKAVADVRKAHRAWIRDLFAELAAEAGVREPKALSEQLVLLYDGSMVGAHLDRGLPTAAGARTAAAALLDAALGA